MLTFYDFNPTPEEIPFVSSLPKEKYLRIVQSPDSANYGIAWLFFIRGDKENMIKYAEKIKDIDYKNQFYISVSHPV